MAIPAEQLNPKKDGDKPAKADGGQRPFTTADEVRAAFTAGRLTRDQAKAELKKFGMN